MQRAAWIRKCALGAVMLTLASTAASQFGDVTPQVERLGNPYAELYPDGELIYARNIWDMQAFDGRLYLGAGNSSNTGPAVNAGPLPIISLDPAQDTFRNEFIVDDEQIDRYRILDGRLYLPGHDPTQSWDWGNFYRLGDEGWVKYRNIPDGIHNYDMTRHDGRLFAALGARGGAAVSVSEDDGHSWTNQRVPGGRVYAFLDFEHALYATTAGMVIDEEDERVAALPEDARQRIRTFLGTPVSEWRDGEFVPRDDIAPADLMPDTELPQFIPGVQFDTLRLHKPVLFGDAVVYIGARIHNDHQFIPLGLFAAHSLAREDVRIRRLLPDLEAGKPWDLFERDGRLYVLTARPAPDGKSRMQVWSTADIETWNPVLSFTAPTFARAFEWLDGAFYFGLGFEVKDAQDYDVEELHPDTGEILRFDTRRVADARLIQGLTTAEGFAGRLAALLSDHDEAFRAAGRTTLAEFVRLHDPARPRDRAAFLHRMEELFADTNGADDALRQVAYGVLLLHADFAGGGVDRLLTAGHADPQAEIRTLAAVIDAVRAETPSGRALIRQLHARDPVRYLEPEFILMEREDDPAPTARRLRMRLRDRAFAEFVQRPGPAFPDGAPAEAYETISAQALPLTGWTFQFDRDAMGFYEGWYRPDHPTDDWRPIDVGVPWHTMLDEAYVGVGWYRIRIDLSDMESFDALGVHFGAVDENAWVWIDGRYAGQQNIGPVGWEYEFQLDITSLVEPGATHEMVVRVRNTTGQGGIWKPVELRTFRRRKSP